MLIIDLSLLEEIKRAGVALSHFSHSAHRTRAFLFKVAVYRANFFRSLMNADNARELTARIFHCPLSCFSSA